MKYKIKESNEIKKKVNAMSVDELLLSIVCPNEFGNNENLNSDCMSIFIHPTDFNNALKMTNRINSNKTEKTLILSDMEAGAGIALKGKTAFPSLMALAKTKDKKLIYQAGLLTAKEAREAGFHWTLGPVADILLNSNSPIASIRCASDDYKEVISYAKEYIRGLHDNGLIATLKHFPGDGICENDQHLTVAINDLSKETWMNTFGNVYRDLIDFGIKSIMVGHIAQKAFDNPNQYGQYPPATLSKNLMNFLKHDLGFKGIIISDAVEMSGFCGYMNLYKACATFIEYGGDMLLFMHPSEEYFMEMKKYLNEGILTIKTLRNRVYRILCFADEYFAHETKVIETNNPIQLLDNVTKKSVEVFRDYQKILPLNLKSKVVASVFIANQYNEDSVLELNDELRKICSLTYYKDPGPKELLRIVKSGSYDYIICTIGVQASYGTNMTKLSGTIARNMMGGWMRYGTPVIFIDFYHPFIHMEYDCLIDTLIYTYGYTNGTIKRVIELIHQDNL